MLYEASVDGHRLFFLGRDARYASPEASRHGGNFLASVGEVHFERRVADHEIELAELLAVVAFVVRGNEGVALDGMVERRDETIEQEIEFEHLVGTLRDILSKDSATVFADLVS